MEIVDLTKQIFSNAAEMPEGDYETPFKYSLHYRLDGTGSEKILLVIGFSSCFSYWGPLVDAIHERFPGRYTTCIYDQRGIGSSTCVATEKCSTTTIARDILGMLLHLGWVGKQIPLHLISWSMGGFGSIELVNVLLKQMGGTLNLTSLTLCNTGHKFVFPPARSFIPGITAVSKGILSILFGIPAKWIIPNVLSLHYSPKYLSDPQTYAYLSNEYTKRAPFNKPVYKGVVAIFQHLYAVLTHYVPPDRMRAIRESDLSIHAIVSSEDSLIHATASIRLARSLGCGFSYLPGGHMSHVENTQLVIDKLAEIWDEGLVKKFAHFRNGGMNRTHSLTSRRDWATNSGKREDTNWVFSEIETCTKLNDLILSRMDRWGSKTLFNRIRSPGRLFIAPALVLPIILIQLAKIFSKENTRKNRILESGLLVYVIVLIMLVQEVTREEG